MLNQNFIFTLFFGIMIAYIYNQPPKVVFKYKKLDNLNDINIIEDTCPTNFEAL